MTRRYRARMTYQNFMSYDENFVHAGSALERLMRKKFIVIHNNLRTLLKCVAHLRYRARRTYQICISYNENFVHARCSLERPIPKNFTVIHDNLRALLNRVAHLRTHPNFISLMMKTLFMHAAHLRDRSGRILPSSITI